MAVLPAEFDVRAPATGAVVGTAEDMDAPRVAAIVARARAAQTPWGAKSVGERVDHLRDVRRAIADHCDELAALIAAEVGKPEPDAYLEAAGLCFMLSYAIRAAPKVLRRRSVRTFPLVTKRAWVEQQPYGVVGQLTPWNAPLAIAAQVMPSAWAAGNVVVVKPSELAPLSIQRLAEVVNGAGHPLLFPVTGFAAAGQAVVGAGLDKIVFTGSTATARHILRAAAEELTPAVLELGGKDAMIVAADADVPRAARAAVSGAFFNSGQACVAVERVYVAAAIYDEFVAEVTRHAAGVRQGPEPDAHVGAMVQATHLATIEARLRAAEAQGAKVLLGGRRRSGAGTFFEPTVVVDVDGSMELMREETFGPVLAVQRVDSVEEAIRSANESPYGLNGSVFTADRRRAEKIASALTTGGVNINDAIMGISLRTAPFGGTKASGFGRVQGPEGLLEFSRSKTVVAERFGQRLTPAISTAFGMRPSGAVIRRGVRLLYGTPPWHRR